jgi:hypothetical protein
VKMLPLRGEVRRAVKSAHAYSAAVVNAADAMNELGPAVSSTSALGESVAVGPMG